MTRDPLQATDPRTSASVVASAGTGKTWLLVTRMLRLLLAGAEPGGLLAVTFTNRAAGEMHARLMERAVRFATCTDDELSEELAAMDMDPGEAAAPARSLLDTLLAAQWPPRVVTFHAFCQDLLARFPLEAGVPPGFELLASERELHDAAWEALLDDCGREPDGDAARALDGLTEECGSLDGARKLLRAFVAHRADWWAWTAGAPDALAFALTELTRFAGDPDRWPDDLVRARITRLCTLVGAAPTAATAPLLGPLTALLADAGAPPDSWCAALDALTLVSDGKKARDKLAKKNELARAHGAEAEAEVRRLQAELIAASADRRLARLNRDWMTAGTSLLERYQRLKAETRVLDFADLEWAACRLLNETDQAPWIQYRLDARIDHVLVDEFQDTNPTQWRMLQPLLAEIAAGDAGRARSAFLVGDPKQAIYGFRRADPRLLDAAAALLETQLGAPSVPLEGSRRSATAIMDCVNAVFAEGGPPLPGFTPHSTHLPGLHGRVEWLPVPVPAPPVVETVEGLRNPLVTPRGPGEELGGLDEARTIAARIRALIDAETVVGDGASARAAGWDDVMILVRQRTRLPALEYALREAHIPYASDSKGMLLERPEILDLLALLEFLVAPWNSLQLARLLKAPLFACSDDDLLRLAPADPDARRRDAWYPRLLALADAGDAPPALARAAACLRRWREAADRVPVHDLLDRIFAEGDVLARYRDASPPHLQRAVTANLVQFLDLALDADSGRYPTLHRLVERLERTRAANAAEREFNDAPVVAAEGRVRVLTVHAAKGLEAPIVFVAQCDLAPRTGGLRAQVDWPPDASRPNWLLLAHPAGHDTVTHESRSEQQRRDEVEDANLLYVALTRARQYLFVSGQPADTGWYPRLAAVFETHGDFDSGVAATAAPKPATARAEPDPALALPVMEPVEKPVVEAAAGDPAAAEFGVLVHAALESVEVDAAALARICGRPADDPLVGEALATAARVRAAPGLRELFETPHAWCEARLTAGDVYGVVDRVVVRDDEVWVIDYKTHPDPLPRLAWLRDAHRPQLERYRSLAQALWPGHRVRTALLFTAVAHLEECD